MTCSNDIEFSMSDNDNTVSVSGLQDGDLVSIYDSHKEVIIVARTGEGTQQFSLANYAPGYYVVNVYHNRKKVASRFIDKK